eukprot:scpid103142/ scgid2822/ 
MTYGMNSGAEFFIPLTNWLEFLLPLSPEQCPDLVSAHFNYKPIAGFSRAIGARISILCQAGYLPSNGLPITNSTCQIGGEWDPSPPGCEKVSPTSADTDVTATPQSPTSVMQTADLTAMSSVTVRSASPASKYSSTTDDSAEEGVQSATVIGVGIVFGVVVFALSIAFIFAMRRHCRASGKHVIN